MKNKYFYLLCLVFFSSGVFFSYTLGFLSLNYFIAFFLLMSTYWFSVKMVLINGKRKRRKNK